LIQEAFETIARQRAPVAPTTAASAAPAGSGLAPAAPAAPAAAAGGAAKAQKAHANPFKAGAKASKRQKTASKASGTKAGVCSEGVSAGAAGGGHDGEFSVLSFWGLLSLSCLIGSACRWLFTLSWMCWAVLLLLLIGGETARSRVVSDCITGVLV